MVGPPALDSCDAPTSFMFLRSGSRYRLPRSAAIILAANRTSPAVSVARLTTCVLSVTAFRAPTAEMAMNALIVEATRTSANVNPRLFIARAVIALRPRMWW